MLFSQHNTKTVIRGQTYFHLQNVVFLFQRFILEYEVFQVYLDTEVQGSVFRSTLKYCSESESYIKAKKDGASPSYVAVHIQITKQLP